MRIAHGAVLGLGLVLMAVALGRTAVADGSADAAYVRAWPGEQDEAQVSTSLGTRTQSAM